MVPRRQHTSGRDDYKKKAWREIFKNRCKREGTWNYSGLYCYRRLEEYMALILCQWVVENVEYENDGKMRC